MSYRPLPDEWIEVNDPTYGRHFRPSVQFHERCIQEQIALGVRPVDASRREADRALSYLPPALLWHHRHPAP